MDPPAWPPGPTVADPPTDFRRQHLAMIDLARRTQGPQNPGPTPGGRNYLPDDPELQRPPQHSAPPPSDRRGHPQHRGAVPLRRFPSSDERGVRGGR